MQCDNCQALNDPTARRCGACGYPFEAAQPFVTADTEPPVAMLARRIMAGAFDASMVLMALALFVAIFFFSGGGMMLSLQNAQFLIAVLAVFALFYQFLWVLANQDSPGTRFAGLRVVDFDGRSPDRDRRGLRQMASLLSVMTAGLGLFWSLFDKRRLAWHDRLSKTFPTPIPP